MVGKGDPRVEADDNVHWFPRTCCSEHAKFDKRAVGLFKLEWQVDCLIGLCSKTYIISCLKVVKTSTTQIAAYQLFRRAKKLKSKLKLRQNRTHIEAKFSSKGISKGRVKAPFTTFRHILLSQ